MWFNGDSIQQALNRSKNEKIMLLTFIKGKRKMKLEIEIILIAIKFIFLFFFEK